MTAATDRKPGQAPSTPVPALYRVEGAAVAAGAVVLFVCFGFAWWWLLVFFLVLDFSFLGYIGGIRAGGIAYNLAHNYVVPSVLLATYGVLLTAGVTVESLVFIAGPWFFHVGLDRALGYGPRPLTW
ncbi:DUF4260 family protein [Agreia sp.]|uniref:DUF4260 family protein n=1 Tax=Agreia sp. TaxID=1872416 RepID=UPI0035BC3132